MTDKAARVAFVIDASFPVSRTSPDQASSKVKTRTTGTQSGSERLGRPGDGGFDGLVRKDPLGFDVVYTQAERYAAVEYAKNVATRIVLVDGQQLCELMVEYACGVRDAETFVMKEIDEDFFDIT